MKNFPIVFAREFRETVRSRFFITTSVLFSVLLLLALALLLAVHLIPAGSMQTPSDDLVGITADQSALPAQYSVVIDDCTDGTLSERLAGHTPMVQYLPQKLTNSAIRSVFEQGADGCMVIQTDGSIIYYINPFDYDVGLTGYIQDALDAIAREDAMMAQGLSADEASIISGITGSITYSEVSNSDQLTPPAYSGADQSGYTDTGASLGIYLMATLMFTSISFYGQMVSARVAHEKSSRMIEVLATSASPAELLCGKVLGVSTAGFIQIFTFCSLLLAAVGAAIGKLAALSPELAALLSGVIGQTGVNLPFMLLYLVLGFVQLAFIYGGLGAMSSDTESVSGFAALPLQLPMIGYFIAMLSPMLSGSALLTAASHIPIISPFAMTARLGIEQVQPWEIILSAALQLAAIAVTAVLSARLYRRGMLRYGQPPKFKELLKAIRK